MAKRFDLVMMVMEHRGEQQRILETVRLRLPNWNLDRARAILKLINDWCEQADNDLGAGRGSAR